MPDHRNRPTCRTYDVDGQPVVVRGNRPLDEQDQAALAEIVRAVQRLDAKVPRGVCPACGNDYHLRADGTVGQHRRRTPQGYRTVVCPGVGQPPASSAEDVGKPARSA